MDIANDVARVTADLQSMTRMRELVEARCGVLRMREEQLLERIATLRHEIEQRLFLLSA